MISARRYTTFVQFHHNAVKTALDQGNNLQKLLVSLLSLLDSGQVAARGEIKDNWTGEIVHQSRKCAIE